MKHLLNYTCRCLLSLVAMIAVSLSASAQSDLLGSGTKVFSATGTLDGTYTTTYQGPKDLGTEFIRNGTSTLDVVSSKGAKVATASVSVSGYDVTFTVSGSTATEDGAYTFTVPQGYFSTWHAVWGDMGCSADKFTINLTGMGGGTDGGEGGGGTQGGGEDGDGGGTGTQPLNVTFDFSHGFVVEKDGVTCEYNGSTQRKRTKEFFC